LLHKVRGSKLFWRTHGQPVRVATIMAGIYDKTLCTKCLQSMWMNRKDSENPPLCKQCVRGLSGSVQASTGPTCGICLEVITVPFRFAKVENESWQSSGCTAHRFCKPCLRAYVRHQIEEGAWNVCCPGGNCAYRLLDLDVRKLLGNEDDTATYARFQALRSADFTAHLRSLLGLQGSSSREVLALRHSSGVHSSTFESWAASCCQACPRCFVVIRKETGCNKVQCRCGTAFCFGCGAAYSAPLNEMGRCVCARVGEWGEQLGRWLRAVQHPVVGEACPSRLENGGAGRNVSSEPVARDQGDRDVEELDEFTSPGVAVPYQQEPTELPTSQP